MASITKLKNGSVRLQFTMPDNSRPDMRLGKIPMKAAREIGDHVEHLIRVKQTGEEPKKSTRNWVADVLPEFPKVETKLIDLGLLNNGQKQDQVFAQFIEDYIVSRKDVTAGTRKVWGQGLTKVRAFFGKKTLRQLTAKDGKDFARWLKTPKKNGGAGHTGSSPSKHLGNVRGFLNEAVDAEIIPANPFRSVKAARTANKGRKRMIDVQAIRRVIEVAPDAEMKAIIALAFWGGLRTPSEPFAMTWGCIRWDEGMMTVISPKTAGVGKPQRETPLFPELVPYLMDLHEVSEHTAPEDFIVQKRRHQSEANLRARMARLCIKAGVERWPKIFQNLRSTRQTILEQFYPRGTVCEWMGNTEDVAEAHYIQEMKSFREQAATVPTTSLTGEAEGTTNKNDEIETKVPQKLPQISRELGGTGEKSRPKAIAADGLETTTKQVSDLKRQAQSIPLKPAQTEVDGNRTHQARVNAPQRF